ncbi:hypothetical protein [Sphingobium olei]|uniref:Uncharacterized protein n=1 Tax=Sphingobium olei TaxID=420955 RepID=A0ABW3NZV7_9SPHN
MTDLQLGQEWRNGLVLVDHLDIRLAELNRALPHCKACGRAICSHPDPVFQGLIPLEERR